ncbi:hypothetical protein RCC89_19750 [Cytophagaceae bacterium ABcell3]|nr:hypothetical protein RCC89_03425 [Cytophagaceae bacterium ABcell3]WMJ75375.1 hypothetical protein RCC89_19750 [Cytophagaceae bacterium ABcell3]
MEQKLIEYKNAGFLETRTVDDDELFHLSTPCRFRVNEEIVSDLKRNYKTDEEIGGVLWAKPTRKNEEFILIIDKVSYIRNAIEDNPRNDGRNKSNAYLSDRIQLNQALNELFSQGYLPVKFHTHPVKGKNFLNSLTYPSLKTETSKQDKRESSLPHIIGNKKLLMPRALIVGNDISSSDIFFGVYSGFIAPAEFENSKKEVQHENFQKTAELISSIKLSDGEKIGLAVGAALLLFVIAKYPKHSVTVIIGLVAILPLLLTNTHNIENPNYFNKLSFGSVDIFIPNHEKMNNEQKIKPSA